MLHRGADYKRHEENLIAYSAVHYVCFTLICILDDDIHKYNSNNWIRPDTAGTQTI